MNYPLSCISSLPSNGPHAVPCCIAVVSVFTPSLLRQFFCTSHPLAPTPEPSPLKGPGNKPWCRRSSVLSQPPHPSSLSAVSSAVSAGSNHAVRLARQPSASNAPTQFSLVRPLPPSVFVAPSPPRTMWYARRCNTVPEKPTQTHTHANAHAQSQTHSWAPAAYKDWGLEINEGERRKKKKKGERSLNKLALEKRRK